MDGRRGQSPPAWLIDLPECGSTNTWALERLATLAHGSVVHTARQTAGRGRDGRTWSAPEGVLTASFVVDAGGLPPGSLALAAGLAVAHAVEDRCPGLALGLKWPNDVLVHGRKLAGILCEGSGGRLVVGIGLNRQAELPAELAGIATSLHRHATPPAALDLLAGIRGYLLEGLGLVGARGLAPLLPQLRQRDVLLGRSITVAARDGRLEGTGGGIDEDGRLLVVVPGGGIARVDAGHIVAW